MSDKRKMGFTLIELLIVIAIIGILAGVVLAVVDPASQRRRANEGVLRAQVNKICLAYGSCMNGLQTPATSSCDTVTEIGVTSPNGTPTGSTYAWNAANGWQGTLSTCVVTCNTTTFATTITSAAGTCLIN